MKCNEKRISIDKLKFYENLKNLKKNDVKVIEIWKK